MGKWAKYCNFSYDEKYEKNPLFKDWLTRTPKYLLNEGKSEAYCKLCRSTIRCKKSDLESHINTICHKRAVKALPGQGSLQPALEKFGVQSSKKKDAEKLVDLRLSVLVACHSSTKAIDHIGEVARDVGKGSNLENLRLHRTKCSKLIERVIAPAMRDEVVADIGNSFYSIICDESTDISSKKQLALCARYYNFKEKRMLTHFLGLIETPRATHDLLYEAFKKFMAAIGLRLDRLLALGTDGGLNLCGKHHSLYALLKKNDCPHLLLVRCICHSIDKSASYASKEFPASLEHMIRESRNRFSHSSVRQMEYNELHQEMFGTEPPLLVRLATTRWLSFYGAVKTHLDQYTSLKSLFNKIAASKDTCPTAEGLAQMHNDDSHLLLLTFLKPILREVTQMNVMFQHAYADITRVYRDLRTFIFSLAQRIIRPEALRQSVQHGMLRVTELEALKSALSKSDSLKPLELVNYGESFRVMAMDMERKGLLTQQRIREVKSFCANFLVKLTKELAERLPECIAEIEKMRHLAPSQVLSSRGRPAFHTLPLHLIPHNSDLDVLDSQWTEMGALHFRDICPDEEESMETIDIVKFWGYCYDLKNGAGQQPFKEIAICALSLLSLPLSNAVVERVFSVMAIVKSKLRNKMSTLMLSAILFVRMYLKAYGMCCTAFQPSQAMLSRFNSKTMYVYERTQPKGNAAAHVGQPEEAVDDPAPLLEDQVEFENDEEAILNLLDVLEADEIAELFE